MTLELLMSLTPQRFTLIVYGGQRDAHLRVFLRVCTNGKPLWRLQLLSHCVILRLSAVFITCTRLFPPDPPHTPHTPSDIMGQSKVTHIYPIIRGFEKTRIELQLMLQWGPKSERCYRPKRLGFQGPTNKRQSSPQRERQKRRDDGEGRGERGGVA